MFLQDLGRTRRDRRRDDRFAGRRPVDFLSWIWIIRHSVTRQVPGNQQSAGDVRREAVGRVQRPHAPQQQSGLVVAFTVYLSR